MLLRRGLLAALDGDREGLRRHLRGILEADPGDVDACLAMGRLQREAGELKRAIALHQMLLLRRDLEPGRRVDVLCELARDLHRAGDAQRAAAAYEEAIAHDRRCAPALRGLVELFAEGGEPARALAHVRALERAEGRAATRLRAELLTALAEQQRADGRPGAALRSARRALRSDQGHLPALLLIAHLELERGRSGRALAAWGRVLELDPERADVHHRAIAQAFVRSGEQAAHAAMLRERIAANPMDGAARRALVRRLADDGKVAGAVAECLTLLERDPRDLDGHELLGRLTLGGQERVPAEAREEEGDVVRRYRAVLDALAARHDPEVVP